MAPAGSCPVPTGSGVSSSSLPDLTEAVRPEQLRGAALGEGRATACGGGVRARSPGLLDRSLPVALGPAVRSQGSLLGGGGGVPWGGPRKTKSPAQPSSYTCEVANPNQSGWGRQIKSLVEVKRARGVPTAGLGRALRWRRRLWGARGGGKAGGTRGWSRNAGRAPSSRPRGGLSRASVRLCKDPKAARHRAGGQRECARALRAEPGLGTRARSSVALPRRAESRDPESGQPPCGAHERHLPFQARHGV